MFYSLFANYLKIKLLRIFLSSVQKSRLVNSKNAKLISFAFFLFELFGMRYKTRKNKISYIIFALFERASQKNP